MPVTMIEKNQGRTVVVHAMQSLTRDDYRRIVPLIEGRIRQHGKIRFVAKLDDLESIEGGALWEDLEFDVKHFDDVERVAIVGDKRWMEWMAAFCKPFTTAEVRYFRPGQYDDAIHWASEPVHA